MQQKLHQLKGTMNPPFSSICFTRLGSATGSTWQNWHSLDVTLPLSPLLLRYSSASFNATFSASLASALTQTSKCSVSFLPSTHVSKTFNCFMPACYASDHLNGSPNILQNNKIILSIQ